MGYGAHVHSEAKSAPCDWTVTARLLTLESRGGRFSSKYTGCARSDKYEQRRYPRNDYCVAHGYPFLLPPQAKS